MYVRLFEKKQNERLFSGKEAKCMRDYSNGKFAMSIILSNENIIQETEKYTQIFVSSQEYH
jgi:hypothetical protein